jgi:chromosome partitioning protein
MIVTVANCAPADIGALVAENMAVLHARTGRKMLLLDASRRQACARWGAGRARSRLRPVVATRAVRGSGFSEQLERLQARYDDVAIVVDTDGGNGLECRCALIAAHVALVPLTPEHADVDARYELIARLDSARMFNPGLRVLFVAVGGEHDPASGESCAMRAYAAQVMSAGMAATILHLPALRWGADIPGRCASDIDSSAGAAETAALHEEVYRTAFAVSPVRPNASPGLTHESGGQFLKE